MKNFVKRGVFITFEGFEGSGKSTQIGLLCSYIKRLGYEVTPLREPGGTPVGEAVRRVLLDVTYEDIKPEVETLLYMASRAQLARDKIIPALQEGRVVICDRFLDSTIAYQGYGGGVDVKKIKGIGMFSVAGIRPDLTILLDVKPERGLERLKEKDRIERKPITYHRKVREGYLRIAKLHPRRFIIIEAEQEKDSIQSIIRKAVRDVLKRYKVSRPGSKMSPERHKK